MNKSIYFFLAINCILTAFINQNSFSQTEIKGILTDSSGYMIVGAQILEIGTENGVASNEKGRFKLFVSDTAMIRISMIGYYDTIMISSNLQGDTILLRQQFYDGDIIHSATYHRSFTVGLFGDINNLPYGIKFSYFKPYLFRKNLFMSTGFALKTNFRSDHDLSVHLNRYWIIDINNYHLTLWTKYQNRRINLNNKVLRSQDLEFITRNSFFGNIGISPGLLYRKETYESQENRFGFYSGIDLKLKKINQFWNLSMNTFKTYSEYSILVSQGFSYWNYPFNQFRFGLNFIKYKYYNEGNFWITYNLN